MTTTQLLTEARRLVAQGWCQGSFALDALDKPISYLSADARRFDLEGALMAASGGENSPAYELAERAVFYQAYACSFNSTQAFNDADGRTLAEALGLLDQALLATDYMPGHSKQEAIAA